MGVETAEAGIGIEAGSRAALDSDFEELLAGFEGGVECSAGFVDLGVGGLCDPLTTGLGESSARMPLGREEELGGEVVAVTGGGADATGGGLNTYGPVLTGESLADARAGAEDLTNALLRLPPGSLAAMRSSSIRSEGSIRLVGDVVEGGEAGVARVGVSGDRGRSFTTAAGVRVVELSACAKISSSPCDCSFAAMTLGISGCPSLATYGLS